MSTCSFMLNGPGFSETWPTPGTRNDAAGRTRSMKWPMGRVATWTEITDMTRGSVRYMKKVLRKERRTQEARTRAHIRKVHTGRVGSSWLDTVSRTSSIGETSSSVHSLRWWVKLPGSI
ncbi:hypothetical protein PanWU01x14_158310, partial [Parasponia andersonii]